eukprot:CAMPEP_0170559062 /NCGR_PEP_ID=MMETSP0211-20121228/39897_1 /TAXON_ID=311385 /ORGANISM="Pseudokeronopsis sp., Strain OXSARD2" /LENGTH=104 /DNA_ID=CAMNT_0010871667 /DNA_START=381 /DNA_END=695 /DNA_ORIENTATION=+
MLVIRVPRLKVGLQVLIDTNYHHCERNVHDDYQGVRAVESKEAFLLDEFSQALPRCEVLAQLQPLLHHISGSNEEIVGKGSHTANHSSAGKIISLIIELEFPLE